MPRSGFDQRRPYPTGRLLIRAHPAPHRRPAGIVPDHFPGRRRCGQVEAQGRLSPRCVVDLDRIQQVPRERHRRHLPDAGDQQALDPTVGIGTRQQRTTAFAMVKRDVEAFQVVRFVHPVDHQVDRYTAPQRDGDRERRLRVTVEDRHFGWRHERIAVRRQDARIPRSSYMHTVPSRWQARESKTAVEIRLTGSTNAPKGHPAVGVAGAARDALDIHPLARQRRPVLEPNRHHQLAGHRGPGDESDQGVARGRQAAPNRGHGPPRSRGFPRHGFARHLSIGTVTVLRTGPRPLSLNRG